MSAQGVTLVRRRLGVRLRRLREQAGKTQEDVAETGIASEVKLWRIESGRTSIKTGDVWALAMLYGASVEEAQALAALAASTRGPQTSLIESGVAPDWFSLYVELEAAASEIETYHAELVHGLLQTEDYARATIAANSRLSEDTVERRVQLRLERQSAVLGHHKVTAVLGAGALALEVGSASIMRRQIEHLRALALEHGIWIGVLPWKAGAHLAINGPFAILSFEGEEDPDVVYIETLTSAHYLEGARDLGLYREAFSELRKRSIPVREYEP
jgi:transcriptional regulator with XRE-family HTH domain